MKMGVLRGAVAVLALSLLAMAPAWAFYPLGGYNAEGQLKLATWPLSVLDTNGDGDVTGANEGIGLTFESGDLGFTDAQISLALAGFETWERITTSYIAYYFVGKTPDPLEASNGFEAGAVDGINYVAFEFADTDDPDFIGDTLGVAFQTFVLEDTEITIGSSTVLYPGGQMVEVDFVLNGDELDDLPDDSIDYPGTELDHQEGIQADCVTLGGWGLGLGYSPLTNFTDEFFDEDGTTLISGKEDRVVYLLDEFGVPQHVGVTPSMVGFLTFGYTDNTQSRDDLAPDDIAGASYLYPRENQTNFFTIQHEARTTSPSGIPTAPLEGAHIVAWCDADNAGGTRRVPFSDTLTGLYELDAFGRGQFRLINLFKQLPNEDGILFEPTYVLACSPLARDVRSGQELSDFDSTHGAGFFEGGEGALTFATDFSSQVFREGGNVLDDSNLEAGTPLVFSAARNKVISTDTEKTIDQMLPGSEPMFGAQSDVCIYNVVVSGLGVLKGPDLLRHFRDNVMLPTAFGTAVADTYYQIAPGAARFLVAHPTAFGVVRAVAVAFEWAIANRYLVLVILMAGTALLTLRRKPRMLRAALMAALVAAPMLFAFSADAQMIPLSTQDLVKGSDEIVSGTVVSVDSYWTPSRRIVTDVTVAVDDVVKGATAKGGQVKLRVLGGQVGNVVTHVTFMPRFKEGEEVVLFLAKRKQKDASEPSYRVKGNLLGKHKVLTDETTKEKYVVRPSVTDPPEPAFGEAPKKNAKAIAEEKEKSVPLDEHLANLRAIVEQQKAK